MQAGVAEQSCAPVRNVFESAHAHRHTFLQHMLERHTFLAKTGSAAQTSAPRASLSTSTNYKHIGPGT
eukprot:10389097-Alexandrium_andersonii.AAC.1